MKILGIKLTHDAGAAVIEDGHLTVAVEMEKVGNGDRYTKMPSFAAMRREIEAFGYTVEEMDHVVIDGWKGGSAPSPCGRFAVAPYHEFDELDGDDEPGSVLTRSTSLGKIPRFDADPVGRWYNSYPHVAGHVVGSYVLSPFARRREAAAVITMDGGQNPRIHMVDPSRSKRPENCVTFIGAIHELYGIIYGIMGYYFGPYKNPRVYEMAMPPKPEWSMYGGYEAPGKLMSYIGLGAPEPSIVAWLYSEYASMERKLFATNSHNSLLAYNQNGHHEHTLMRRLRDWVGDRWSDADVLASIHDFLCELLVRRACEQIAPGTNLIFTGGSALNIKWNSAFRRCGHFREVFVPPVPNDAGSAIGAAACEWVMTTGHWEVRWSAYLGPRLGLNPVESPGGWLPPVAYSPEQLGYRIACEPDDLFVVLHGRAEVGPRALGHRSIFADPRNPENKTRLNAAKARESFRPVAPICKEDKAQQYFHPGTPDPYMLFDHAVLERKRDVVPAILHVDGTARLQTVSPRDCLTTWKILDAFESATGCPMLCNTSANFNGKGFFPDATSAMRWAESAGARFVWAEGFLYERA